MNRLCEKVWEGVSMLPAAVLLRLQARHT